jgi:hypothetical protein
MGGEIEAAGDVLTGAIVAKTIEGQSSASQHAAAHHACLNCGHPLTGAYCAECGQAAHIHRSLHSLGHDILHGVFHFEGKFWSTLPQLFFFPGRLTRRYIDGERAKFVSPMALFLFTVFTMFAVFSVTTHSAGHSQDDTTAALRISNQAAFEQNEKKIGELKRELLDPKLLPARREELTDELSQLRTSQQVMRSLAKSGVSALPVLPKDNDDDKDDDPQSGQLGFHTPWPALDARLQAAIQEAQDHPRFALYKLKTSGYKYSWTLILLSVPFIWLLFFWRRDLPLYDHAIFATYSISFMMLLITLVSVLAYFEVPDWVSGSLLTVAPPIHMYKQLRGTYRLSRAGASIRLFFLLIFGLIVIALFCLLLVILDVMG